jgi:hypothetical protein
MASLLRLERGEGGRRPDEVSNSRPVFVLISAFQLLAAPKSDAGGSLFQLWPFGGLGLQALQGLQGLQVSSYSN